MFIEPTINKICQVGTRPEDLKDEHIKAVIVYLARRVKVLETQVNDLMSKHDVKYSTERRGLSSRKRR